MTVETPTPLVARLLLDAFDEFERAAQAVPTPGQGGAIGRLNPASWIVVHVARQQDGYWNGDAQGRDADPWLAQQHADHGDPPAKPPYEEALAAWQRVREGASPYLEALRDTDLDTVLRSSPTFGVDQTVADMLARSVGHVLIHAGELATIASLVGTPDLGLPGRLRRSTTQRA